MSYAAGQIDGRKIFDQIVVTKEFEGDRLDYFIALNRDDYSRSSIAQMIKSGNILVSGQSKKPSFKVHSGDVILFKLCEEQSLNTHTFIGTDNCKNNKHFFNVIYEDEHILVINKNFGIVVHPAPGNQSGTLVDALINYYPEIESVGEDIVRPGIVHRLDRDTSGIMVIAKNNHSFNFLKKEFMQRRVEKRYLALVSGNIKDDSGKIVMPIGRHPIKRKMMSTICEKGRYAETLWHVKKRYNNKTLVEVELKTGRTHQVRVHFKAIGHPLIGDTVYGFKKKRTDSNTKEVIRQMLHAWKLCFRHPWSGKRVEFTAALPDDILKYI